jgi:hypothetical protein
MATDKVSSKLEQMRAALKSINASVDSLGRKAGAGGAMVSSAALDRMLERAIATKLVTLNREMRDRLFGEFGALRDFSAKIDLAFALGIADRETYKRLTVIRKVRNLFAHSDKGLSFESKSVRDLLALAPGVSASEPSIADFNEIVDLADKTITSAAAIPSLWVKPGKPTPAQGA